MGGVNGCFHSVVPTFITVRHNCVFCLVCVFVSVYMCLRLYVFLVFSGFFECLCFACVYLCLYLDLCICVFYCVLIFKFVFLYVFVIGCVFVCVSLCFFVFVECVYLCVCVIRVWLLHICFFRFSSSFQRKIIEIFSRWFGFADLKDRPEGGGVKRFLGACPGKKNKIKVLDSILDFSVTEQQCSLVFLVSGSSSNVLSDPLL